ncbi:retrovirus-related pol polyprotein from transposon TNT 1-94 [Tanacetum coccineum]
MDSEVMKGLSKCKALESNIRRIRVKDIVNEVEDYLKTYSSAGMDISWIVTQMLRRLRGTGNEFMADLNAEYYERALLENQKRFYKRSDGVRSARKPLDKSKETCFACGKLGHF